MGLLNNPDIQEKLQGLKGKIGDKLKAEIIRGVASEMIKLSHGYLNTEGKKTIFTEKDMPILTGYLKKYIIIHHGSEASSYNIIVPDGEDTSKIIYTCTLTLSFKTKPAYESTK